MGFIVSPRIEEKCLALDRIYRVYDRFAGPLSVSCGPGCAACCTQNVSITTLEGFFILKHATPADRGRLQHSIGAKSHQNRFCPEITLNGLAKCYADGKEIPEEAAHFPDLFCPLVEQDLCSIYPYRPFGCRCLFSKRNCRETGFADMDPFWLTVNTLFLQFIEQIDAQGVSGNLVDVFLFFESNKNVNAYENGNALDTDNVLIQNKPITALLIPSEHKPGVKDILSELNAIFAAI